MLSLEEPKRHRFKRITSMFRAWLLACSNLSFCLFDCELRAQTFDQLAGVLLGGFTTEGIEFKQVGGIKHEANCASRTRAKKVGLSPMDMG